MYEKLVVVGCIDCGQISGRHVVKCDNEPDLRRHVAFLKAFRCAGCWVARQQAVADRKAGTPVQPVRPSVQPAAPRQQPLFEAPVRSIYSEPPERPRAYRRRQVDNSGRVWEHVGYTNVSTAFGG